MTTPYGTNLNRILLPLLAVLAGTLLTAFAFLLAGFASGACHCSRPIALAFPYASIIWGSTKAEWLGGAIMAIQFPFYAVIIALAKSRLLRFRCALILFVIHVFGVIVALFVY
jgi:hypothetical protein